MLDKMWGANFHEAVEWKENFISPGERLGEGNVFVFFIQYSHAGYTYGKGVRGRSMHIVGRNRWLAGRFEENDQKWEVRLMREVGLARCCSTGYFFFKVIY